MIRINVTIEVEMEIRSRIVNLLCEMSELSRKEEGCIGYEILENNRLDNVLMIIETWENEFLLARHKESEHFVRIIPQVRGLATKMCSQKFTDTPSVTEAIAVCRNVENYLSEKIDEEITERLLKAARSISPITNTSSLEFLVIEDRQQLDALASSLLKGADVLRMVPMAILVCCNVQNIIKNERLVFQELGASVQNLMLQACGEKLGATRIEVYSQTLFEKQVKMLVQLSEGVAPFVIVAIGKTVLD